MSNEEANELWDEIGKRATVRSRVAAKVVREGKNICRICQPGRNHTCPTDAG